METPKGFEGEFVEAFTAKWMGKLAARREPKPNTATYNAAYEAVCDLVREYFPNGANQRRPK